MQTIEIIILALTYSSLIISLFLQLICYSKKIENWETIALTISLILLVVSISLSPLQPNRLTTAPSTLICMLMISCATFLETLSKQRHSIHNNFKILQIVIAICLGLATIIASEYENLQFVQNLIVGFLLISIVSSMLIVQRTKPLKQYKHLERSHKSFAWAFLIIIPSYILTHFIFLKEYSLFRIDSLLYIAFLAMAIAKIYEDIRRLSLIKEKDDLDVQKFQNYGLTAREQEVALLLFDGLTYQSIADQLFISMPTVKTHASNIYKKCKVKNRNELTKLLIA